MCKSLIGWRYYAAFLTISVIATSRHQWDEIASNLYERYFLIWNTLLIQFWLWTRCLGNQIGSIANWRKLEKMPCRIINSFVVIIPQSYIFAYLTKIGNVERTGLRNSSHKLIWRTVLFCLIFYWVEMRLILYLNLQLNCTITEHLGIKEFVRYSQCPLFRSNLCNYKYICFMHWKKFTNYICPLFRSVCCDNTVYVDPVFALNIQSEALLCTANFICLSL